jgi:hypothetical protein
MFNLSVDQFFYPDAKPNKSTQRKQLDSILDDLDDTDLIIVESTANGITQVKRSRG